MTISTSRLHIHIYLCKYRIWLHDDHDDESITSGFLLMKSDNKIYVQQCQNIFDPHYYGKWKYMYYNRILK